MRRGIGVLMILAGSGLLPEHGSGRKSTTRGFGVGLLLLLAALGLASSAAAQTPTVVMGIVVAVDLNQGALSLAHGDGTRSNLTADPKYLRNVHIGDPVQAVVEGTSVRTLEHL